MKTRALLTAAVLCLAGPAFAQGKAPAAKEKAAAKKEEAAAKKDEKMAAAGATAKAELKDQKGQSVGEVTLSETPHGVLIKGTLSNLPAGEHAIHIHEAGKCEAPFQTAGGHLNPNKKKHGVLVAEGKHEGDLPNLYVAADGKAQFDSFAHGLKLKDVQDADGAAVVVHASADDYKSDPAGNAGDRIACGVVQVQK
ncbi:Cu-Zn family superoxide dismutase [Archangium gephyra]|uniref:Superoxide dismutase [Cu-Zn] n=1 Tax=Archangium gephyra TaxID=48 RepID=A0AAC8TII1_9BACT|nr:superoxide dismutase family protein [Archangium gephyra]AKJ06825.1 Superoxide dismutase [Archangium gephyra]REG31881.1 Cu-Zn family superoxide dismutase [Archangium gephyra]